jgi:hypothetical protein
MIVNELPRDIPTNELVGRKLFLDLVKYCPQVKLYSSDCHETQYWAEYTVSIPRAIDTSISDSSIRLTHTKEGDKHLLTLRFEYEDPNSTTLPIKTRNLLHHLLKELNNENCT